MRKYIIVRVYNGPNVVAQRAVLTPDTSTTVNLMQFGQTLREMLWWTQPDGLYVETNPVYAQAFLARDAEGNQPIAETTTERVTVY